MPHYLDFDLELFAHRQTETADRFSVRVQASPVGEQRLEDATPVVLPLGVRQAVAALRRRQLPWAGLVDLGDQLGRALFPPPVRRLFASALATLTGDDRLRVRLKLDTYGLAELPWEYASLAAPGVPAGRRGPEGFLVLDRRVSLVRYESQEGPLVPLAPGGAPLRLVVLLADPVEPGLGRIDVERERRSIEDALAGLPGVRAEFHAPATADALMAALVTPAHVFHFAGHGRFDGDLGERYGSEEGQGAVVLVDDDGRPRPLPAQHLALALTGCGVRLVVLTACEGGQRDAANPWAGVVTALTRRGIPAVVGMQFGLRDANATLFSRALYRALAAGQPIDAAVTDGRLAILTQAAPDERDWGVPVLYLRAGDGVLFPGPEQPAGELPGVVPRPPSASTPGTPPRGASAAAGLPDKRALREAMVAGFSTAELEILCSDIEADLAAAGTPLAVSLELAGGQADKAQCVLRLIGYLERRGQLPALVDAVRRARPGLLR